MTAENARIVEPEETAVARQRLSKHASTANISHDRSDRYTRNNRRIFVGGVFYMVRSEEICQGPNLRVDASGVEARSNTSTVTLLVVGDDEKGIQYLGV
jgi:hypothetical protein